MVDYRDKKYANRTTQAKPKGVLGISESFKAFQEAHSNSDVDNERDSLHHTIGFGETQAASGAIVERLDRIVTYRRMVSGGVGGNEDVVLANAGWRIDGWRFLRDGNTIQLEVLFTRTGGGIVVSPSGNIPNQNVFAVKGSWIPSVRALTTSGATGRTASGVIDATTAQGVLAAVGNDGDIYTNEPFSFLSTYIGSEVTREMAEANI